MKITPSALGLIVLLLSPTAAAAQLSGFNIKGDLGLKAGTQAPPGGYVTGFFYRYGSETIRDRNGATFEAQGGDVTVGVGAAVFTYVTNKKILGAFYGVAGAPALFVNRALESPRFPTESSAGFSDLFVTPISLGWHLSRADVATSYTVFVPTGRYEAGATDNTGLGMWGHEVAVGATAYLTENRAWHAATSAAFELHSGKEGSDAKVGTLLTLEGGAGRDFLKGAASVGLVYYAQWKISADDLSGLANILVDGKNRSFAIGPELALPIATKSKLYGFFNLRYEFETYARTSLQGQALAASVTILLKPIDLTTTGKK